MKISAKEITQQLQVFWPGLKDVWPMDSSFWCPTYRDVRIALEQIQGFRDVALKAFKLAHSTYIKHIHDCDNYALELQADLSRYRFVVAERHNISLNELLSWPQGSICSMRVNGRNYNHTHNICITSDAGIVFVEPQDFSMWVADRKKDQPYFVEMR